MWLTKQRGLAGEVFGSVDRFEGLGIFFDTYKNNRPGTVFPYIMAMMGDGVAPYDKANDGKDNELMDARRAGSVAQTSRPRLALPTSRTSPSSSNSSTRARISGICVLRAWSRL